MKRQTTNSLRKEALDLIVEINETWNNQGGYHVCTICLHSRVVGHRSSCRLGKFVNKNRAVLRRLADKKAIEERDKNRA